MKNLKVMSLAIVAGLALGVDAATVYVSPDVSAGSGSGTEADPYNLYSALTELDKKTSGADEIILKSGTYDLSQIYPAGTDCMVISARNKNLSLRGETDDCTDVVIDGKGSKAFVEVSGLTIAISLSNMSFTNCYAGSTYCGGVVGNSLLNSVVNVSNCAFRGCRANSSASKDNKFLQGGAIFLNGGRISDCVFEDCMVSNTLASNGMAFVGAICGEQVRGCVIDGCFFRDCKTYATASSYPSGWSVCGIGGGGAIFVYSGSCVATNCYFESCRADGSSESKYIYGGAMCTSGSGTIAYNCFFTNCYAKIKAGALNHATVLGSTIVECTSGGEIGAVGVGGFRIQNSLIESCHGTSIVDGEWNGGDFLDSVFRNNVVNSGSEAPFVINGANTGVPASGHVVSNCIFVGNGGKSVFYAGSTSRDLKFLDNIFIGNSCNGHGVIYAVKLSGTGTSGMYFRNCYFAPQDYMNNAVMFYDNAGTGTSYASFENCSFIHYQNGNMYAGNKTPKERTLFKNCFFWNLANKNFPSGFQDLATVTNCVFVQNSGTSGNAGQYVNLDPQYGNRVIALNDLKLAGGNKKFDWNSTLQDAMDYDWRPTKSSPLVNACTNQFDVTWVNSATRRRGPWDMGDGTWTEAPYRTVTIGAGKAWEKTYNTGITFTRNNVNARRAKNYLDIGCFEYMPPNPGMSVIFR